MSTSATALPPTPSDHHGRPSARTLARTEWRLFSREPVGLVWGTLLPVLAVLVLGLVPATRAAQPTLGGQSFATAYQPIVLLLSASMLAVNAMPAVLASYRERGVLRRLRLTPMPASQLLLVQMGLHAGVAAVTAVLVLAVGAATGVRAPAQPLGWALAYGLTLAALLGLGVVVAALAPSAKVANAAGATLFFPLMFFAGLWVPRAAMPGTLRTVSDWTPLGAGVRALSAASDGRFPPAAALLVLAAYALVLTLVASRTFRWE